MSDMRKLARDIGAAPLGDLITSVGKGVAEAQAALDTGSLEQSLALYDQADDLQRVMRETGYRPTFYTIPETEGELKLAMTMSGQQTRRPAASAPAVPASSPLTLSPDMSRALSRAHAPSVYVAPIDGHYQNSYNYSSQVGATIKFKIVAVPPPSEAEAARVVPDLAGMTIQEASDLGESFDLRIVAPEDAVLTDTITGQDPGAGTLSSAGNEVTVTTG